MRTWKEVIQEATSAEIKRAGEAALRDERNKNKAEKITKGKSSYQKYLDDQLEFKKEKYEAQKKAQIEKSKEKNVQGPLDQAKASLKGIQTQTISDKDKEGTAYSKLMGNAGSAAVGVSAAAIHGMRALAARKKTENTMSSKKPKKSGIMGGRPLTNPPPGGGPNKANEEYSNWREELLIEVDEKDKGKKKIIIDVMK